VAQADPHSVSLGFMGYYGAPKLKVESTEPEDQEWYLHSLIEHHEDSKLLAILDADYQIVKKRDKAFGNTLLHHAAQHKSSLKVIDYLLEEWPEACQTIQDPANDHPGPTAKPNYHWLPLHIACMSGADATVVKRLLDTYPDAAKKADTLESSLPLHLCICRTTDEAVLALLLEAYPEGASVLGSNMDLPLHRAITLSTPSVVKTLLKAFPRGVKQRTFPLDRLTPLEQAKERQMDAKVGTPQESQEIIDAIISTKTQVDAEFKSLVASMPVKPRAQP